MKKTTKVSRGSRPRVLENRSFRRMVKQMFTTWMKRQSSNCSEIIEKILRKLERKVSIDIMARKITRQAKQRKGQPNE